MTPAVRRVGAESASEVLAVIEEAFSTRPVLDPPASALSEDLESVRAALKAHGGLLATVGDTPVGCLLFAPAAEVMELRRVGVVPTAQGSGVAGALVEAALHACLGYESLTLLARVELPETIDFWLRHGFVEERRWEHNVRLRRDLATTFAVPDAAAMQDLGVRLGQAVKAGDLVVLSGELGAGKTTLTQGLAQGLQVRGPITSPTFVIARVHPSLVGGPNLVHVDAYRLGDHAELDDLDLDTDIDSAVTVVEWGEGLAEGLSESRLAVRIDRALAQDLGADGLDPRRVSVRRKFDG